MSGERIVVQDLGEWVVRMEWPEGVQSGGPGVLVIEPADPDSYPVGGLSSTVLRQVDFRGAADRLRAQLATRKRRSKAHERYEQDRSERLREALRHGVTEEYLALLASAYVSAVNRGQTKPLEHLADMTGKTASTIKGHLWQARKKGLLTGSAGRKGGQLTDKATKVLERIVPGAPSWNLSAPSTSPGSRATAARS